MKTKLKYALALIIEVVGTLAIAYIYQRFIELIVIIPLLILFRRKHTKTFHKDTYIQCATSTLILMIIIGKISAPLELSVGLSVVLSYIITEVLFFIQDYKDLIGIKEVKIRIGMNKTILKKKCEMYNLSEIETNVLVYFYCDRLKRWQIGNILNYSEDNISKIKVKALNKFKKQPSQEN